ncbi:MAG: hypothetical protein R3183_00870 [Oleiphilaceae bacterium]|nr:hypothetical protein [Oleiphilaceae bacterium]
MKTISALILLFVLATPSQGLQNVDIYTYDILPPYAYRDDNGRLTGIYIEMVRRAIERMPDYSATFHVVPWARAKEVVKKGEAFAILPPYFHAHDWLTDDTKQPYIWPYSLALYHQSDVVICNEKVVSRSPRPNFPSDYKGLSFVMFRGDGRAGPEFTKMVERGDIELHLVSRSEQIYPFLQSERADCTATSELPFEWNVKKFKQLKEWAEKYDREIRLVTSATIATNDAYLGYTDVNADKNYPFKKDFSIKFDIEIHKMKVSGERIRIINEFIH